MIWLWLLYPFVGFAFYRLTVHDEWWPPEDTVDAVGIVFIALLSMLGWPFFLLLWLIGRGVLMIARRWP